MSLKAMRARAGDLKDHDLGKGTIRFLANKRFPASLTRKPVKARIAENDRSESHRRWRWP
jgi:uncharacterized protein YdhG (YjbR/CyaY superfamily)